MAEHIYGNWTEGMAGDGMGNISWSNAGGLSWSHPIPGAGVVKLAMMGVPLGRKFVRIKMCVKEAYKEWWPCYLQFRDQTQQILTFKECRVISLT